MWLTRDEYPAMNPVILQRPDGCAVLLTKAD